MKKFLAGLLAVMMILSVVATMIVSVGATASAASDTPNSILVSDGTDAAEGFYNADKPGWSMTNNGNDDNTYKVLDIADLTVDGSFATGGAVAVILILNGWNLWLAMLAAFVAGLIAGAVTGLLHTLMGIPPILAGILTQLSLYSINLKILLKTLIMLKKQLM